MALTKGIEKKDTEKNSQSQLPKLWPKYIYKKTYNEKKRASSTYGSQTSMCKGVKLESHLLF